MRADIDIGQGANALMTGRIQKRKTNSFHHVNLACNTLPVHTEVQIFAGIGADYWTNTFSALNSAFGSY
jgi:hypothetical protein